MDMQLKNKIACITEEVLVLVWQLQKNWQEKEST